MDIYSFILYKYPFSRAGRRRQPRPVNQFIIRRRLFDSVTIHDFTRPFSCNLTHPPSACPLTISRPTSDSRPLISVTPPATSFSHLQSRSRFINFTSTLASGLAANRQNFTIPAIQCQAALKNGASVQYNSHPSVSPIRRILPRSCKTIPLISLPTRRTSLHLNPPSPFKIKKIFMV